MSNSNGVKEVAVSRVSLVKQSSAFGLLQSLTPPPTLLPALSRRNKVGFQIQTLHMSVTIANAPRCSPVAERPMFDKSPGCVSRQPGSARTTALHGLMERKLS